MKVDKVTNILISTHANKHKYYLYNECFDFAKEHGLTGGYGHDYITIEKVPENLLDKLKKLGIKFMRLG